MLAAALTALTAFGLSGGGAAWCIGFGSAIATSMLVYSRLPKGSLQIRAIRLVLMGSIIILRLSESEKLGAYAYIDMYITLVGQLSACEMALQFWQWPPWAGERGAIIICLSGLVFVAAAKTEDHQWIQFLTPAYILFLLMAVYAVRPRQTYRTAWALPTLAAVVAALVIGGGTSSLIWNWRNELTLWFTRLTLPQGYVEGIGISQTPVLGATSNLRLSPARVLRIEGPLNAVHLRGVAFDAYGHGIWGPPLIERNSKQAYNADLLKGQASGKLQITRLSSDLQVLVAPLHCAGVVPPRGIAINWDDVQGGPLRTSRLVASTLTYDVLLSAEDEHQGPLCPTLTAEYRARCLTQPPLNISWRVRELALSIAGNETNPRTRAERVATYLRTNYKYSRTTDPGKDDPVSSFLINKKAAHCEYFASATVILLRYLDIPARYVTGYYAHDSSPDNITIVRQHDAHAWAECWIDGQGWITLDATPAEGLPNADADAIPWTTTQWEWIQDKWDAFRDWLSELSLMQQAATALILAAVMLFLQWLRSLRARMKTTSPLFVYTSPAAELAGLATRFEQLLKDHRTPCPAHRTWLEHLAALKMDSPKAPAFNTDEAAAFAQEYARVRFGRTGDAAELSELRRKLQMLAASK